jgi:NADH-quinone oxidoreductase subunit N
MNGLAGQLPNIGVALPEMFVFTMACVILLVDLYAVRRARFVPFVLTLLTLVGAAVLTLGEFGAEPVTAFNGMFVDDMLSDTVKLVIYALAFLVFLYSRDYALDRGLLRGEYLVLGLFGVLGMMVMASAGHFLTVYLGLELLALSQYTLVAFDRDSPQASEAAMKYFVLGALASGMLLYGMSMLYGATGSLDIATVRQAVVSIGSDNLILVFGLVFVVVGVAFKVGAAPFHMWIPDVYHGAPTSVTLYVGTAPKLAAFALIIRLLVGGLEDLSAYWSDMLIILAVLSMAIGNLSAIVQSNIKRMLAYSTIAHMGYFLLGILTATPNGYGASLFYVIVYGFMSLAGFGMVILLSHRGFEAERLEDFKGLNRRSRWQALVMLVIMFSMAGVPPTLGFFAKLSVIQALIEVGLVWLAVVAVLFAVVGAFYYLRVVKLMYFDEPGTKHEVTAGVDMRVALAANGLALVLLLPWVGAILDLCTEAVRALG